MISNFFGFFSTLYALSEVKLVIKIWLKKNVFAIFAIYTVFVVFAVFAVFASVFFFFSPGGPQTAPHIPIYVSMVVQVCF